MKYISLFIFFLLHQTVPIQIASESTATSIMFFSPNNLLKQFVWRNGPLPLSLSLKDLFTNNFARVLSTSAKSKVGADVEEKRNVTIPLKGVAPTRSTPLKSLWYNEAAFPFDSLTIGVPHTYENVRDIVLYDLFDYMARKKSVFADYEVWKNGTLKDYESVEGEELPFNMV